MPRFLLPFRQNLVPLSFQFAEVSATWQRFGEGRPSPAARSRSFNDKCLYERAGVTVGTDTSDALEYEPTLTSRK